MSLRQRWIATFAGNNGAKNGLSKEAYVALFIHGCFQIGASMSGLFLNLYLWRLTENLWINGVFNIIVYGMTPVAFALGGWIAKKKDRMVTYRLGIVLIAVFFLIVVFAREQVVTYYPWFALFNGTALGLYWTGYLVLMYDVTNEENRAKFLAVNMIVFNSAGLAGPAISGFLISRFEGLHGYMITFAVACALFAVASLFSTKIRKIESNRRTYYLKFTVLMMKREPTWLKSLFSFVFLGLFQGIMLFLPNILLFQAVKREDWVGLLAVLFSLLTILTGFLISRQKDRSRVRTELFLSSAFVFMAASVLMAGVNTWTVISFMVIFSLFNPLTINTLTSYYYRMMDFLPLKGHFRIESVVLREVFLNTGRVISIYLLILFVGNPESPALPIVLVVTAAMQFGMIGLVTRRNSVRVKQTLTQKPPAV
ncbi:MFS transporter [Cohnella pontilimi]|uniref:MFS transporter n=1 Tax=Cohnella pontilimi TaxID=2564100 RepID=A0A4U0FHG9_9BACL|nr:MFS transporter [Cohnella pontilimi]TJY44378.1 MFS transporter [Cohnella pontilimi]